MVEAAAVSRSRIPWLLAALVAPMLVATLILSFLNGSFDSFIVLALVMIVAYPLVGALIASREPSNPLGWLMLGMGLAFLVGGLTDEYVTYTYGTNPGALPFGVFAGWLTNWIFLGLIGPVPLFIGTFPTGRPPTARWRFLPVATYVTTGLLIVAVILSPGPIDHEVAHFENPTGVGALGAPLELAAFIGWFGLPALIIASIVGLALRFRSSIGEERQQIRWFAYAALAAFVTFACGLATSAIPTLSNVLFFVALAFMTIGVPVAIAVAVLRYRLYDLDIVIKKAAVFVVLVAIVFVLGFGVLVLISTPMVERLYDLPSLLLILGLALGVLLPPLYRLSRRIADRVVYGGRANPYEVLASFSDRVGDAYATDDVLPRAAAILHQAVGASVARVWLHVGRELRPVASSPDDAPTAATVAIPGDELPAIPEEAAFEVRHQGDLLGALSVRMPANDPMNPSKERLIRDLASQAGLVLRNVVLIEDLRESRRRIVSAQDERARRLERDIHDGAQQQLVALAVQLRLAKTMVGRDPARAEELLGGLETATASALEDLRDLARGIYPPLLADKGLVAALEAQARKAPVPVRVDAQAVGRYAPDVESAVYFCTLEALNNVAKYAAATEVTVAIAQADGHLSFSVRDDGDGFDPATAERGSGLQGMADRLAAVSGQLGVQSRPGAGTTVTGSVPVNASSVR